VGLVENLPSAPQVAFFAIFAPIPAYPLLCSPTAPRPTRLSRTIEVNSPISTTPQFREGRGSVRLKERFLGMG
jgi:hypothetical protein